VFNRSAISSAILLSLPLIATAQSDPNMQTVVVKGAAYLAADGSSAMKQDVPLRDTPFSVSSYTGAFMNSIDTSNVSDLYKYMTGIQRAGATAFDMSIRGFRTSSTDRNAIMVDGLPGLVGRFGSPPTIGIDHVEVVKGPASVLYGQAQPGGFVNVINKAPLARAREEFDVRLSTFDGNKLGPRDAPGYDVAFDVTGPVKADPRFRYRLVADTNDVNNFRDYTYTKGPYIAPSVSWQFLPSTSATLALEYRRTKVAWDKGLVAPNRDISLAAPITTRYQQPDDHQTETGHTATLSLHHNFDEGAKLNFSVRDARTHDESYGYDNVGLRADLVSLQRRATAQLNRRTSDFWDANLVLPFDGGFAAHKAIFGVGGGRDTAELNRAQFFNGAASGPQSLDINLYAPVYSTTPPLDALPQVNPASPGNLKDQYTQTAARGVYVADLLTLSENWKANLGLRRSVETQYITDLRLPFVPLNKSDSKVLPMAGLLYQPSTQWTYYASYSNSFVPAAASAFDATGNNPFVPETSTQLEVGSKADLLDGRLQTTLALFSIKKKNTLSTFGCALGSCSQQIGAERSEGVELEINARPVKALQLAFGASHVNANISASKDPAQVGARLVNGARNNAHIWSRYDAQSEALRGWGLGLGLSYVSERAGNLPSTASPLVIRLPAFSLADLGVYYSRRNYELTFKVTNLFDKTFFESTGPTPDVQLQPGAPRNLALSLRVRY
jgi:iron complex outermembrane receptor protein